MGTGCEDALLMLASARAKWGQEAGHQFQRQDPTTSNFNLRPTSHLTS